MMGPLMKEKKMENKSELKKETLEAMKEVANDANLPNAELQALFEEWTAEIEREILSYLEDQEEIVVDHIAEKIGISKKSILYLVMRLNSKDEIEVEKLKVNQKKN